MAVKALVLGNLLLWGGKNTIRGCGGSAGLVRPSVTGLGQSHKPEPEPELNEGTLTFLYGASSIASMSRSSAILLAHTHNMHRLDGLVWTPLEDLDSLKQFL